jgi:hypothetical protein
VGFMLLLDLSLHDVHIYHGLNFVVFDIRYVVWFKMFIR